MKENPAFLSRDISPVARAPEEYVTRVCGRKDTRLDCAVPLLLDERKSDKCG